MKLLKWSMYGAIGVGGGALFAMYGGVAWGLALVMTVAGISIAAIEWAL